MREAGFEFTIQTTEVKEDYPPQMKIAQVPEYLAQKKAEALAQLSFGNIILTADTIVTKDDMILGKPESSEEAIHMLTSLSGKAHQVVTGVCIVHQGNMTTFSETTEVHFREISNEEITYYIKHYAPFDKAGAYGIQEWIGHIGIEKINGSYFNVVGLPISKLYNTLKELSLVLPLVI